MAWSCQIALLDLSSSFPKFLTNFRYFPLPSSSDESNNTRLLFHGGSFFQLKRVRVADALAIITVLVFLLSRTFIPHGSLDSLRNLYHNSTFESKSSDTVDWTRFAYTQYATNQPYLCNFVMLFEILHRLDNKADKLFMYPSDYEVDDGEVETESLGSRLLRKARDAYNVKLQSIQVQRRENDDRRYILNELRNVRWQRTDRNSSDLGGKLHKAACIQSNTIRTSPEPRLELYCSSSTLLS